jgi:SAM-dependent methyltransferase
MKKMTMTRARRTVAALALAAMAAAPVPTLGQDVPYVPTPPEVVDRMLRLAEVNSGDVVYDLGCGDGRIVVAAASRPGVRAVCVEISPERIAEAKQNAVKAGVQDRIQFVEQDLFTAPIKDASVVTLYLLPSVNLKLRPRLLRELRPGTRIVSHAFDMGDWKPEQKVVVEVAPQQYTIYRWTVPAQQTGN